VQQAQRRVVLEREADRVEQSDLVGTGARPATTSANSVTAKSAAICWISPSMRDFGSYSTMTRASGRRTMTACSSVLPGQSPPTAFRCMPGSIISGVRITARRLSAVTVVPMSEDSVFKRPFFLPHGTPNTVEHGARRA